MAGFFIPGLSFNFAGMPTINIRPASLADLSTLLAFEQDLITAERPFDPTLKDPPINYYDIEAMIKADHIHLLVAASGDELIGCGYARIETAKPYLRHLQHAYLGFMYVLPSYRGQGVNRVIIDALKQWSLSKAITELRLDVYYNNSAAIQAYEKSGFTRHMTEMRMSL